MFSITAGNREVNNSLRAFSPIGTAFMVSGHGNRSTCDKPRLIETLKSKRIRDVACGSSHAAALSSSGELYTWGLGEYGRLGHGDNTTHLKVRSTLLIYCVYLLPNLLNA